MCYFYGPINAVTCVIDALQRKYRAFRDVVRVLLENTALLMAIYGQYVL